MAVRVRQVDLNTEYEELQGVLERNLTDLPHARRFKWLYLDHPLGPAWAWLAWETEKKQTIGVAAVFRRAMWLGGRVELCGQVGDFGIDASHRSLGPAVMLQRATFEPVEDGSLALCYDCPPHERGMSTFRRLGVAASATMTRYARLLRTDRQLAKRLGAPATRLAPLGNAVLRLRERIRRGASGLEITPHEERFGEEFSSLDRRLGGGEGIRGRRAADDLNWRYREDPLGEYRVLTARRKGELVGFAVLAIVGRDAVVVDLQGVLSPAEVADLLDASAKVLRVAGAEVVQMLVSGDSPLGIPLGACGFRVRSTGPLVVAHTRGGGQTGALLGSGVPWNLTYADVMA
jgi:hypothetical protein